MAIRGCGRLGWSQGLRGLPLLLLTMGLGACTSPPETVVEPPLPKPPIPARGATGLPADKTLASKGMASSGLDPSLAPLASPQQVIRSVDVGRPDPFAAVFSPLRRSDLELPTRPSGTSPMFPNQNRNPQASPLQALKGFQFQGVLQGAGGAEALVEYTPEDREDREEGGLRAGSLRVGDIGSRRNDSLLPPGWRVRAIDGLKGELVLEKDGLLSYRFKL